LRGYVPVVASETKRFAQQTTIRARAGRGDDLVRAFLEAAELQRQKPACELMLVGSDASDSDVVYVTEIWSTEADWEAATRSPEIKAWAKATPELVARKPETVRLEVRGGKGIAAG
jgi:quinol monooxygenase YgiN